MSPTALADQAAYEHNHQPVSRQAFYAIACNPARSVAVEACAGAGKTWMLVSRILRALLDGSQPHEILAITFTKKAAGEMRQRLQEWLQHFAQPSTSPQVLEQELIARGMAPQDAPHQREALQNLYQTLLSSARPVQIRTFHSWFAALLSSAPLAFLQERGLPTHYELLEDDSRAVAEVWPSFFQAVVQNAQWRDDYQALIARHGRAQVEKALEAALNKRIEFTLADDAGIVQRSVAPFTQEYPSLAALDDPLQALQGQAVRQRWLDWAKQLGAEKNKTPQKAAQAIIEAFERFDLSDPSDPYPPLNQLLTALQKALFVAKEDRLQNHLQKYRPAQEAEPELQLVCAACAQHHAWQHQQRMVRLSRVLIDCFGQLKRTRGWVDMNDVERTALELLSDPLLSGWVQERLDMSIRHLLVDEFQDTNPLQWHALYAWLSGYAGAGGGQKTPSVFIVGDPKQSIYRFRRAEPQVFQAAQRFIRDGLEGDLLACDHTRRNAKTIVHTVNTAMLGAQGEALYSGFRVHTSESPDTGALLHLPPIVPASAAKDTADTGDTDDTGDLPWRDSLTQARHEAEETAQMQECAQVARWIEAQLAAGLAPKDIMVLARRRERLSHMESALRALHIVCVQPEKTDLTAAPAVQDIVALLDVLVSPGHDLSLARALKSPLFGASDALLTELALLRRQLLQGKAQAAPTPTNDTNDTPDPSELSWFDMLLQGRLATQEAQDIAAHLRQYRQWVAELPPHDALQAIYQQGDVLARFAAATPSAQRRGVLAHLRALLSAALQQDAGRYLTPYAFVRALKKGGFAAPVHSGSDSSSASEGQAVQLLTVHGAKGLEAHSVLLLDTDAAPKRAESMGVLVDWPGAQTLPQRFIFLESEAQPAPSLQAILQAEQSERRREEMNTLYVAMTRAKQRLVLSAVQSRHANPQSWYKRLKGLFPPPPCVPAVVPTAQDWAADTAPFLLLELPAHTPIPSPSIPTPDALDAPDGLDTPDVVALIPEEYDSDLPARQGLAMHALLEQIDSSGSALHRARTQGWSAAHLAQLASRFALPQAAAHSAAEMAQTILNGEGAWAWDAAQLECALNEAPLTYQGQNLRLDRVVCLRQAREGACWWVLDYKSAAQPELQPALIEQLQRYRQAVAHSTGQSVNAAFLTGEGHLITWISASENEES